MSPWLDLESAIPIREDIRKMSGEKFYAAQARLTELDEEAAKLVRPIFERLTEQFDAERRRSRFAARRS
jgi:hypothetical protein